MLVKKNMFFRVFNLGHILNIFSHHAVLKTMLFGVCNLGHTLKPTARHAGSENIWFVRFNLETLGARREHTNKLY